MKDLWSRKPVQEDINKRIQSSKNINKNCSKIWDEQRLRSYKNMNDYKYALKRPLRSKNGVCVADYTQ